eukprot:TRINITY_DN16178_c0_g4_i1.p1 TRINITY_DN16178_c0_g4~~TRINITY_DN16178_c0_g4_i1.p1  ORF type:complete len:300 (+),score=95.61 TRINITY_DN16178_c0_g4_i1:340-1239(+)
MNSRQQEQAAPPPAPLQQQQPPPQPMQRQVVQEQIEQISTDPLLDQIATFYNNFSREIALPPTEEEFAKYEEPKAGATVQPVPAILIDIYAKHTKVKKGEICDSFKMKETLAKDIQLYKEGKIPRSLKSKAKIQFKKDNKDQYEAHQNNLDNIKMLADFRLKIDATKHWLTKKINLMNVKTSIEDFLRISYARLRKALVKIDREVMTTYKNALIANMKPTLESYIQNAELKLQDSMKAKADKLQKRRDEDDKYEQFNHDVKHVALADYLQEIEHRLIQVVLAAGDKKKQAYVHVCKSQQ